MKQSLIILIIVLSLSSPVFAWHTNTHLQMTRDAVMFMPADLQKLFKENIKIMEPGVRDPDEVIGDFQNHYYLPDNHEGGAIDRIDSIISILQTKLQTGKDREAARQFCYLAHYIADLWTPESLIKKDQRSNQQFVWGTSIVVLFEGYQYPIKNYRVYFQDRSFQRWALENSENVNSLLYSEAVNDIAQTWLSVWHESGKSIQPISPLIIEHNKEPMILTYDTLPPEEVQKAKLHALIQAKREESTPEGNVLEQNASKESASISNAAAEANRHYVAKSLFNHGTELTILEHSLKTVGNYSVFVARLRQTAANPIKYFSVSCSCQEKKLIEVEDFNPGEVVKIQSILPANVTRSDLQYRSSEK